MDMRTQCLLFKQNPWFLLLAAVILVGCEPSPAAEPTTFIASGRKNSYFMNNLHEVRVCGDNYYGQMGDGTNNDIAAPQLLSLSGNVQKITGGGLHTLILAVDGTVWSCGNNSVGQLGVGTTTATSIPTEITSLNNIVSISGGDYHSLFLKSDGTVWACGSNLGGQLGDGTTTNRTTPVQVSTLSGVVEVSAGYTASLFLKSDGTVWSCGANVGQLGDGTTVDRNTPVQVIGLNNVVTISAGRSHSLFLKNDGTVWGCGDNSYGALGNGITAANIDSIPFQIPSLTGIVGIAAGRHYSVFLKDDGTVYVCGSNNYGQLGMGSSGNYFSTPTLITGINQVIAIATGDYHTMFLKEDGSVWVCGNNTEGQLGLGTTYDVNTPSQVTGL